MLCNNSFLWRHRTWLLLVALISLGAAALAQSADELLRRGDELTSAGNLVEARALYERAISAGAPVDRDYEHARALGLAYLNAEPHDFTKAARWLRSACDLQPSASETRLQLANALAWGRQYDAAIEQYRTLLTASPDDRDLRMQIARVLSWSKRYRESISEYDALLKKDPKDVSLRIERARVLSWDRRYAEAVTAYDQVLASDPANADAQIGKAQVLYWSGNSAAAYTLASSVLAHDPHNSTGTVLMAALEHNRGNEGRALSLLQNTPPDDDTRALRADVRNSARPVLHTGFGFENDREEPFQALNSTYRTLRYTSGVEFNVAPTVRMDLINTFTQNGTSTPILDSFGDQSLTNQTMARVFFSPEPWLRMEVGAGEGSTGTDLAARRQHFLYAMHPVVTAGPIRFDFTATRQVADYTPLAVALGLIQDRLSASASYTWKKRVRIGSEYWHGWYGLEVPERTSSFHTQANGVAGSLVPLMYNGERFTAEFGVRYDFFRFNSDTVAILDPVTGIGSSGIFMPQTYQRYSGTAELSWAATRHLRVETHGSFGPQRVFQFPALATTPADFGTTGTFGGKISVTNSRFQPYIGYEWFSTETPASPTLRPGNYISHFLTAGLRYRF